MLEPYVIEGLELIEGNVDFIEKEKRFLAKKFSINSYKSIDRAVLLANYLFCLGMSESAKQILDSFIHEINYSEDREDLWCSVGQGVLLRAYIAGVEGERDHEAKLAIKIIENDIMSDRLSRSELYAECLEDYQDNIDRAIQESRKYKCEIYGQEALTFIYFYEVFKFDDCQDFSAFRDNSEEVIDRSYSMLKGELLK